VEGPHWRAGDPTLTVSEIAEKLRPIASDAKATLIRLSHWTLQGMLIPVDQMHAGTGKRRIYAADDVYSAAILHVLTAFGLTVSAVRPLVDGLSQARSAVSGWKKQRGELYFKVWWRSPGRASFWVDSEPPAFKDLKHPIVEQESQPAELLLAIDLNELWARIEGAP
jgi:DNA-binding transcriptional MerR regulator